MARGIPKASAQSTVLWSIGDLTCQKLEKRTSIDTRRLASNAAYGAVVLGPVGHLWYEGALVVSAKGSSGGGRRDGRGEARLRPVRCSAPRTSRVSSGGAGSGPSPRAPPGDDAARGGGGGGTVAVEREPSMREDGEEGSLLRRGDAKGPAGLGRESSAPLRAALDRARASRNRFPLRLKVVDISVWARPDGEFSRGPFATQLLFVNAACAWTRRLSWVASHPGALARMWEDGWVEGRAGAGGAGTGRRGGRERDASHYSRRAQVVMKS